jgi:Flp pilus assembly protein TadD
MLRQAIRLKPDFARAHNSLASILYQQGDPEGAARAYRRAIRSKPDFASPRFGLATILRAQGDDAGAIGQYREIVRSGDDDHLQVLASKMLRSMGEEP